MTRCAIYCRVSTLDQDNTRQERELVAAATRAGHKIVEIVREKASGAREDRKGRAGLLRKAKGGGLDAIWCLEASRWSRSLPDLLGTLQALHAAKVSLHCLNGIDFDVSTPHGKMIASVLGAFAQFERELIRERTMSGLAQAKLRGKKLGRPSGRTKLLKYQAEITKLRGEGFSIREIARRVNISTGLVQDALTTFKPISPHSQIIG